MNFAEFMQLALYHPQYGYYTTQTHPIGISGDFITAPELSPLFGYTLANQCAPILKTLSQPILLEFGAGTGQLCADILTQLAHLNALPDRYLILDVSPSLKNQQKTRLSASLDPALMPRIEWINEWPKMPFNGVLIANEVLDAMPVHRFLNTQEGIFESQISLHEPSQTLIESFEPSDNQTLIEHVHRSLLHGQQPYASECNLWIKGWLAQCARILEKGVFFIIDYGFPRHEYYHPDRNQGTLMCHSKHQTHSNPLTHPGEEDITAHVDFTHVAECAHDLGFWVSGYTHQASFLLSNELLSFISDEPKTSLSDKQAIKKLTHPHEMGELFKVLALTKQFHEPLRGFLWNDKRQSL